MTTKQYLGQINRLDKAIDNKLEEIDRLREMATSISISADPNKVQTSGEQDKLGEAIAKIVDLERETYELVQRYIFIRTKIINQIDELAETEDYELVYKYFVNLNTKKGIAQEMHWSEKTIERKLDIAMRRFETRFGKKYLRKHKVTDVTY